jgi:hypothetical protein
VGWFRRASMVSDMVKDEEVVVVVVVR